MNNLRSALLVITAVAALSLAHPAKANTITTFNVSGTCTPFGAFTGTTFGGTITIDVTGGSVTAIDLSFLGVTHFTPITSSGPNQTEADQWHIDSFLNDGYLLQLDFTTPGSLVGFTGGTIVGNEVRYLPTQGLAYNNFNGSITAPGSVPDGGSSLMLLGFALLGLVALRRKLSCYGLFHKKVKFDAGRANRRLRNFYQCIP